jgi:signal transduction histidine kinase
MPREAPPMRSTRIFLVQLSPASRPLAITAARDAFPEAEIIEVRDVDEARRRGAGQRSDLMVLTEPDASAAAQAVQSLDASGLPQWAVVILGGNLADMAETVARDDWNIPLLARVFRSTLLQHELLCENLRLQGDLKTVARRISHDLYTPVGCIYTSSHVLKVILSAEALPSIAVMVRNIEESSAEISQIVERVSFVLRASADPAPPVRLEMGAVVGGVLRQMEADIQKSGATVTQPATWPEASGVPQWVHVIWWNLLGNALKHGGKSPQVRLAWNAVSDGYRFSIADGGKEIAPTVAAGLFRPFDQLHLRPGAGLGLSIVQRLVALQGGQCGYDQAPDGSWRFYFTLPTAAPVRRERAAIAAAGGAPSSGSGHAGTGRRPEVGAKSARTSDNPAVVPSTREAE